MIEKLSQIVCDECRACALPGDNAAGARKIAALMGYSVVHGRDICLKCLASRVNAVLPEGSQLPEDARLTDAQAELTALVAPLAASTEGERHG